MALSLRTPWWLDRELAGRVWRGTQLDVERFAVPPPAPDPVLVSLAREPFTSVDDVADRLGSLEGRLVDRGDRRRRHPPPADGKSGRHADAPRREGRSSRPAVVRPGLP